MTRPHVTLNMASSLDGKIAPAALGRPAGRFVMSRGSVDGARMRELRGRADAILIGAGNLREDDPDLAVDAVERALRRGSGVREPLRVVVTRSGDGVTPDRQMFDPARGGPSIVVHTRDLPPGTRAALAQVAELALLPGAEADIGVLLEWLAAAHGCRRVLAEGGGALDTALFAARAVDELYLTLSPRVLGGGGAPTMVTGPVPSLNFVPDAILVDVERAGDELLLHYRFDWSSAS
jgi:riboflavin-specific deaminase-like protein